MGVLLGLLGPGGCWSSVEVLSTAEMGGKGGADGGVLERRRGEGLPGALGWAVCRRGIGGRAGRLARLLVLEVSLISTRRGLFGEAKAAMTRGSEREASMARPAGCFDGRRVASVVWAH
jgi:hypothetical protein